MKRSALLPVLPSPGCGKTSYGTSCACPAGATRAFVRVSQGVVRTPLSPQGLPAATLARAVHLEALTPGETPSVPFGPLRAEPQLP